jgi:Uma2 family endonuclease
MFTIPDLEQLQADLQDDDKLTLPDLLPSWELVVSEIWPPVFE